MNERINFKLKIISSKKLKILSFRKLWSGQLVEANLKNLRNTEPFSNSIVPQNCQEYKTEIQNRNQTGTMAKAILSFLKPHENS